MRVTYIAAALAIAVDLTSALGINCQGSGNCPGVAGSLAELIIRAEGVDNNRIYKNGQNIVCVQSQLGTGLCAFLQNTAGVRGDQIKTLLRHLRDHGCVKCGSVPVKFPGDNDPNHHGILTVNAVGGTGGCNGVC